MGTYTRRNRSFDRIGDSYGSVIDHDHFLGRSAFDIPRKKGKAGAANVQQIGELLVLEVLAPGFQKEDLTVAIANGLLVVRGARKYQEAHPETEYIIEEFDVDSFERRFRISPEICKEKVEARYEDGILRITFTDVPPEEEKNAQFVKVQ